MSEIMVRTPQVQAFLLCEKITRNPSTGAFSLHEIGRCIYVAQLGLTIPELFYYVQFTDLIGSFDLRVELWNAERNELLCRTPPLPLKHDDILMPFEWVSSFRNLKFDHAGEHDIRLYFGDPLVATRRIQVRLLKQ